MDRKFLPRVTGAFFIFIISSIFSSIKSISHHGGVKAAIVKNGELDIIEVHGAELIMSSRKRIESYIELAKESYKDEPATLEERLSWLNKCLKSPRSHSSGVIRGRAKLRIAELNTEKQLDRWLKYLQDNDIPARADDNMGYPYNSIINFDNKSFYSMKDNW